MHAFLRAIVLTGVLAGMAMGSEAIRLAGPGTAPVLSGCEPDYPPYCIVTPANQADGFSVELLRETLKAMGREVVFKTGPWAEIKQELADGKLEVLPLVGRTPEREALYDFTVPYLTMHGALFIRRDAADIRTWEDVKGKRVAVMEGDNAEEYVRRVHLSDRIITSPSFEGAFQMLADGRADAVIAQKLMGISLLKRMGITSIQVVGRPSEEFTQTFSFAVRKGNGELLSTLNEGLAIVMAEGINWKLKRKWMGADARETALARVLIYGGDYAFPPYEFLDEKGRPSGFNIELARAIARQIGVEITFQLAPWTEVRHKIENGEVDLACMFYSESRVRLVEFAVPHTLVYQAVFARKDSPYRHMDDLTGRRISVQNGDIMHEYAVMQGIGDTLTVTATSEEALALLEKGQVDYTLGTYLQGLHWINENGWRNLRAVETRLLGTEYGYAFPKGNTALCDLFNDGLRQTKETGEYRKIYNKWLGVLEPDFEWQRIAKTILLVSVIASLLVAIALGIIFTLRRQVRSRTRELSLERAFLDRVINAIGDPVFVKDDKRRFVIVNDAMCAIVGRPRAALLSQDGDNMFPPEQVEVFRKVDAGVLDTGAENLNEEALSNLTSGEVRTIVTRKSRYVDPTGKRFLVGVIRDFTERKQAETKLRVQVTAMEATTEAILIADRGGIITWVNPAFTLMTGYAPADIVGQPASILVPEGQPDADYQDIQNTLSAGEVWKGELLNRRKDGSLYPEEISITPVCAEGGVVTHQVAVKRDITERRRMEAQLRQQQKLAAVGTLACGMGHEINNPIMGIINYAQLIKDRLQGKDGNVEEFAGEIVIEAERIAGIVRGLSAFATRDTAQRVAVSVTDLVEAALAPLRDALTQDHITLEVDLPDNLPAVVCDRGQIAQAVTSLLSNARDALNERYPGHDDDKIVRIGARVVSDRSSVNSQQLPVISDQLSVTSDQLPLAGGSSLASESTTNNQHTTPTAQGKDVGSRTLDVGRSDSLKTVTSSQTGLTSDFRPPTSDLWVRLTVEDHGTGIPLDVREHIFEPFFTTKDKSAGADNIGKGLGLFVSHAYVQEHGGMLSVESEVGQWTRLHVDLPAVPADVPQASRLYGRSGLQAGLPVDAEAQAERKQTDEEVHEGGSDK